MNRAVKKLGTLVLHQASRLRGARRQGLLVLTYHRVAERSGPEDALTVSLENFARQLRYIKEHFRVVSGRELAACLGHGQAPPPSACLITFDDGWADNYEVAFPVLRRLGLPAVIFLSSDFIGTTREFWHEKLRKCVEALASGVTPAAIPPELPPAVLAELLRIAKLPVTRRAAATGDLVNDLKRRSPSELERMGGGLAAIAGLESGTCVADMLSWRQVREMHARGITFGSHGSSHAILTRLGPREMLSELLFSKQSIEAEVGAPVHFVAYPNGDFNDDVLAAAARAGYIGGFTCVPGWNRTLGNPLALRRMHMSEESSVGPGGAFSEQFFAAELSGVRLAVIQMLRRRPTG